MGKVEQKECIAMLLAGGRGERLGVLTEQIAKPAVSFGGKYRIIDFPLTNCVRSGIDTVGVMTQYQPMFLHNYIAKGQYWDLDLLHGGVLILPPHSKSGSTAWYSGTANAVFQNQDFIKAYDPEFVLILAGDHVYKMDYSAMLDYHKQVQADCTIGVMEVPLKDASRFGVMAINSDNSIIEFEEKPENPKSTLVSMGVYIFNTEVLLEYLCDDENDQNSAHDFGKNIIPKMLSNKKRMYAYNFVGYWKDIGTIESLWQANMDLLDNLHLGYTDWRVLSRTSERPPHFISSTGSIKNTLITEGCEISGTVVNSVLSAGVIIEEGAVVRDSILMENVKVCRNAVVNYAIIDESSVVCEGASIGEPLGDSAKLTVIARESTIC